MHFEGDRDLTWPAAELWPLLSDARFLVQCVPGLEGVPQADADSASWSLRPGLAFVRGKLDVTLRILERVAGERLRLRIHGKGIGSSNTVDVTLTLTPLGSGTRVRWAADLVELGGLLKAVPQGLIKASAQKVITDAWAEVEARLQGARPG